MTNYLPHKYQNGRKHDLRSTVLLVCFEKYLDLELVFVENNCDGIRLIHRFHNNFAHKSHSLDRTHSLHN